MRELPTLSSELAEVIREVDAIKLIQPTDDKSIRTSKFQITAGSYDFSQTTSAGNDASFNLIVVNQSGNPFPFQMYWFYSINNTAVLENAVIAPGASPIVSVYMNQIPDPDPTVHKYNFYFSHNPSDLTTATSYLKIIYFTTIPQLS